MSSDVQEQETRDFLKTCNYILHDDPEEDGIYSKTPLGSEGGHPLLGWVKKDRVELLYYVNSEKILEAGLDLRDLLAENNIPYNESGPFADPGKDITSIKIIREKIRNLTSLLDRLEAKSE
jgi:hypothetical protein